MNGFTVTARGHMGGQISFDGTFVEIAKRGVAALVGASGAKRIPLASVTAVQLKPAGILANGFIQLTISGGNERTARYGRQTFDAANDENSVIFTRKQQPEFEALRDALEHAMAHPPVAQLHDLSAQLAQLAQLHQAGALSEAEFAAAKARALGR